MLRTMFLLILFCCCLRIVGSLTCPSHQFVAVDDLNNRLQCCDLCQKGYHMKEQCSSLGTRTQCTPCPQGQYNDQRNNHTSCLRCRPPCSSGKRTIENCTSISNRICRCPPGTYWDTDIFYCQRCRPPCSSGKRTIENCTSISNRICRCPPGTYWDTDMFYCQRCQECLPGERETRQCTEKHDRTCSLCPEGTYPNGNDCALCTHCKTGQTVVKECGAHNTICQPKNSSHTTKDPTTVIPSRKVSSQSRVIETTTGKPMRPSKTGDVATEVQADHSQLVLILVCGSIVMLVVIILIFVMGRLVCRFREKAMEEKTKTSQSTDLDDSNSEKHVYVTQSDLKKRPTVKVVDKGMLWRDVAGCYSDQLTTILNPVSSNDWSVLAGNLGCSPQEIGNFQLEKKSATQFMLLDWGTTNESTVYRLYQALKLMRRDDAADTLLPLLTESDVGSMV